MIDDPVLPEANDAQRETFQAMLNRGVLSPEHRALADSLFAHSDFTILVLHAHLLVEKALNAQLKARGVPDVLLGAEGLEFHQKYKAYFEVRGKPTTGQSLYSVLNKLRNNIAHEFWHPRECVKDAFQIFLKAKKNRQLLEETADKPIDSVKLLFLVLASDLRIIAPKTSGA